MLKAGYAFSKRKGKVIRMFKKIQNDLSKKKCHGPNMKHLKCGKILWN